MHELQVLSILYPSCKVIYEEFFKIDIVKGCKINAKMHVI